MIFKVVDSCRDFCKLPFKRMTNSVFSVVITFPTFFVFIFKST